MCQTHAKHARGEGPLPGPFKYSAFHADLELAPARPLDEIEAMSPEDMARASRVVSAPTTSWSRPPSSLEIPSIAG